MKTYICNAFSINMLKDGAYIQHADEAFIRITRLEKDRARALIHWLGLGAQDLVPAIGHQDTARLVAQDLDVEDTWLYRRETVQLGKGDRALVAQYRGPRLPEGCTRLPEGARIEYYLVQVL